MTRHVRTELLKCSMAEAIYPLAGAAYFPTLIRGQSEPKSIFHAYITGWSDSAQTPISAPVKLPARGRGVAEPSSIKAMTWSTIIDLYNRCLVNQLSSTKSAECAPFLQNVWTTPLPNIACRQIAPMKVLSTYRGGPTKNAPFPYPFSNNVSFLFWILVYLFGYGLLIAYSYLLHFYTYASHNQGYPRYAVLPYKCNSANPWGSSVQTTNL